MNEVEAFRSLAYIVGVGATVPIVLGLLARVGLAEVVLLLAGGMAIGENGLRLAHADAEVSFVSQLGLGMLSLLAGLEVDPLGMRSRDGARAVIAWVTTLVAAVVWMSLLSRVFHVGAWAAIAIAMTSTALGTLLPMLIVAVSAVAVEAGQMTDQGQSIVVMAGMLTVLVLPLLAVTLHRPEPVGAGSR